MSINFPLNILGDVNCRTSRGKPFHNTLPLPTIDQVQAPNNSDEIDRLLITKEAYWSAQLFSLAPHGLNKRKEFHSINRICYN